MKYGIVCCSVWDDQNFTSLSYKAIAALVFLWSHPKRNSCGIYRDAVIAMASNSPFPVEDFLEGFNEAEAHGFVLKDSKAKVILLHNYVKHCPPSNPNIIKSWLPVINTVPDCAIKEKWRQETVKWLGEQYKELFLKLFPKPFWAEQQPELARTEEVIAPPLTGTIAPRNETIEKKAKKPKAPKLSDEEFVDSLRKNTAYRHLDIDVELGKMGSWIDANPGRTMTRMFIVRWLNRAADERRPVSQAGQPQAQKGKLTAQGSRNAALIDSMLKKHGDSADDGQRLPGIPQDDGGTR